MKARLKDTGEIIELAEEGIISHDGRRYCWHQVELLPEPVDEVQPSLPSNLDEATDEYALDIKAKPFGNLVEEAFKAGAQRQKEQMMKDAVEGTVHNFSSNKPHPTVLVDAKGFNQGDKVRIIIVKEDER